MTIGATTPLNLLRTQQLGSTRVDHCINDANPTFPAKAHTDMPWSHHSHSGQYCLHAKGTLREVLDQAVARGFELYGCTEHMPRFRMKDLYPEESHLSVQDLNTTFQDFYTEARQCQKDYSSQLNILVGLETDVIHPDSIGDLLQVLKSSPVDYIVGSVHHANETPIDFDRPTFDSALALFNNDVHELCNGYFDAQWDLIVGVQPEVIGHFDLCRLWMPDLVFRPGTWARIERNVKVAVEYGALFEVNAAAFRKGWATAYPGADVLKFIMQRGGRLCLSDDSHGPHAVGLHYQDAFKYLREQGVEHLYYLDRPRQGEQAEQRGQGKTVVRQVKGDWWLHPFFQQVQN